MFIKYFIVTLRILCCTLNLHKHLRLLKYTKYTTIIMLVTNYTKYLVHLQIYKKIFETKSSKIYKCIYYNKVPT